MSNCWAETLRELALYCISRAAESFGECLMEWGYISPHLRKARVDIALFCLATSTIMACVLRVTWYALCIAQ
ncbi:hypothetical protein CYMTET_14865 [Cymbomonas tetramitiformis]|uniref:Uncharacterized protein n=1 Tax=Cymbomonas tetramitiformis TaxID=36881 RepID=A0AAE0L9Y1_9CHLO|nr:hypothetical protein CYMTET_14865 [Cymbomonas tetramitiformis]